MTRMTLAIMPVGTASRRVPVPVIWQAHNLSPAFYFATKNCGRRPWEYPM